MSERILKVKTVMERVGISRPHIYTLMAEKRFPAQIQISGTRAVGWVESEIDAWIQGQIALRDAKQECLK